MKCKILAVAVSVLLLGLLAGTVKADDTNVGVIPTNWATDWYTNIVYPDNTVLHDGHASIRLEPSVGAENPAREIDYEPPAANPYSDINVSVGDHIIFRCWIKIDAGTVNQYAGARIGFDLNGVVSGTRVNLASLQSASYPDTYEGIRENYVQFNTVGWVQRTIDFYVPAGTWTHDNYADQDIPATSISQIGPWMQVWGPNGQYEEGDAWFADAEIYVNPTATPSPSPTASTDPPTYTYPTSAEWSSNTAIAVLGVLGGLMVMVFRFATKSVNL